MQARMRAAEFNACPMPRKHDFDVMSAVALLDAHVVFGNDDGFAVMAPFEAAPQGPGEQPHLEARLAAPLLDVVPFQAPESIRAPGAALLSRIAVARLKEVLRL